MRVQDFMSTDVETISPKAPAEKAWTHMKLRDIHHLVVMSEGKVAGIVSHRDLGGARGKALRAGRTVADVMTAQPVRVRPESTVRQAANLLRGRSIGCLPVVNETGRLRGIVTTSDLLELIGRGLEHPRPAAKRRTARKAAPRVGTRPGRR